MNACKEICIHRLMYNVKSLNLVTSVVMHKINIFQYHECIKMKK